MRAYSFDPEGSAALLERLMGAERDAEDRFVLRGAKRGGWIAFDPAPAERGRQSAGTVHHIAWGTYDADLPDWIERINEARHPELAASSTATTSTRCTSASRAGCSTSWRPRSPASWSTASTSRSSARKIILPPFLEDQREQIEAPADPAAEPARGLVAKLGHPNAQGPKLTTVVETAQITPHLTRVVVSGDDLAGFGAGEFTDHYVKLQLPPPGASYSAPFDMEDVKARLPA